MSSLKNIVKILYDFRFMIRKLTSHIICTFSPETSVDLFRLVLLRLRYIKK